MARKYDVEDLKSIKGSSIKELIEDKGKLLFLKREDKEAINYGRWNITNADIVDWPMMDLKNIDVMNDTFINKMRHRLLRQLVKFVGTKNVVFMYFR